MAQLSAWQRTLAALPKIGEPLKKGTCPVHGEDSRLNIKGKCTACSVENTKKQYSLRHSQMSLPLEF